MIAVINIHGVIGELRDENGDIEAPYTTFLDVVRQVEARKDNATQLQVHINSPGGLVEEGYQIHNYLKNLDIPVKMVAGDECSSIATVIFLSGEERLVRDSTQLMIHNPWSQIQGDSHQMEAEVKELRALENDIIDFYHKRTGTSKEALSTLMKKETVLTPEQAVELGFATDIFKKGDTIKAYAYSKQLNNDTMSKKNENDTKTLFSGLAAKLDSVIKLLKPQETKALVLQDASGESEINFPEVEEGQAPSIGDMATIDGGPAEGDYIMPDGATYVFSAGSLTEIRPPADESEEVARLREENQRLRGQLSNIENEVVGIRRDYQKLKALTGDFNWDRTRSRESGGDTKRRLLKEE